MYWSKETVQRREEGVEKSMIQPEIGVVINVDTRPGYLNQRVMCGMHGDGGARSIDFMTDNVINKINFFRGYDIEITLYLHRVDAMPDGLMSQFNKMIDLGHIHNFVVNSNTRTFMGKPIRQWHDTMYLNAIMLSRAKYIAHFDGDTSAYRRDECDIVDRLMNWVESGEYEIVSYPSYYSPHEGPDQLLPGDPAYLWASTRFFFCRRDWFDYNKFIKCFDDGYWVEAHQGEPHRYPNVTEQILGFLAGPGKVLYPPKDLDQFMIFCWHTYLRGLIGKLNFMSYDEVNNFIMTECGGIGGPCDVNYTGIPK
jgi:hypothetical protein